MKVFTTGLAVLPVTCKACPYYYSGGRAHRRDTGCYASQKDEPDIRMGRSNVTRSRHADCPLVMSMIYVPEGKVAE